MKSIFLWLLLLGAALGGFVFRQSHRIDAGRLMHAQMPQKQPDFSSDDRGLAYLNFLRSEAGLPVLAHSPQLARAAANHARYLLDYPQDGHDENHAGSAYFSGRRPVERARRSGYLYAGVHENVSTGGYYQDLERPLSFYAERQIDGLMTAVYHRFSLLDQYIDEAGIGFAHLGAQTALTVNQGKRAFNRLCGLGRLKAEPGRRYYRQSCHNGAVVYEDEVKPAREFLYVVYPVGRSAMPYFQGERPDPMPGYDFTGNPVSIAFGDSAGRIEKISFKLFQGGEEIVPTHLLHHQNDPNRQLTPHQFALFPLQPLAYDTEYRAEFVYRRNGGRREKAEWTFRTQKPYYPYFLVSGGETLAVETGEKYFIHWRNRWCLKDCGELFYRQRGGAKFEVLERQPGGVLVRVNGVAGGEVKLMQSRSDSDRKQALTLYLVE